MSSNNFDEPVFQPNYSIIEQQNLEEWETYLSFSKKVNRSGSFYNLDEITNTSEDSINKPLEMSQQSNSGNSITSGSSGINENQSQISTTDSEQQNTYEEEKARTCAKCDQVLASRGALSNHLKKIHKITQTKENRYSVGKPLRSGRPSSLKKQSLKKPRTTTKKIKKTLSVKNKPQNTCICGKSYQHQSGFYNHVNEAHKSTNYKDYQKEKSAPKGRPSKKN